MTGPKIDYIYKRNFYTKNEPCKSHSFSAITAQIPDDLDKGDFIYHGLNFRLVAINFLIS